MYKVALTITAALSAATFSAGAANAACGEVTITDMDWASSQVVTSVSKFLMEQGYGCTVNAVPSSTNTALVSLAENGTPDIATEMWGNATPAIQKLVDQGKAVFHNVVLSDGGQQGWWVPKYLVDEHPELATLEGVLANAELLGGRLFSCPDGWKCKNINGNLAKAARLEEHGFEVVVPGSGEVLASSLAAAYSEKAPWFGYYWAPTPLLGKNPMVLVDLGEFNEEAHACNIEEVCDDPKISPYPYDIVSTVVTPDFIKREPEIAKLMGNISFSNPQMGDVLAWREENTASADEAAVYFLTNYKDVWAGWLSDDAKKNLSNILK
jgi:glycine betaine/proline transport system substrate-binding protein